MNYDMMSVDALLAEYVHAQWVGFYTGVESEISIKAALRKAVIREASVGEITVKITEYEDEITSPVGSPDRIVTCNEQFICQKWIPEGTYKLVPKETP